MVVALIGIAICGAGLFVLSAPARLMELVGRLRGEAGRWIAAASRIAMGLLFVFAAAETAAPEYVRFLGVFAILGAIVVLLMGRRRFDVLLEFMITTDPSFVRATGSVVFVFGISLIWAGVA